MTMILSYKVLINNLEIESALANTGVDSLGQYTIEEITLKGELLQPQELCLRIRRNSVVRTNDTVQFSLAPSLIGKTVKVEAEASLSGAQQPNNVNQMRFEGTIVQAEVENHNIICYAFSSEAALKGKTRCQCFMDMKLADVVKSFWNGQGQTSVVEIHAPFDNMNIPYLVQYNESDYDFLVRLAKRFGEFFYFDKDQGLVFGKVANSNAIALEVKKDFRKVSYELKAGGINFNYTANHFKAKGDITSGVPEWPNGQLLDLFQKAKDSSPVRNAALQDYIDYPHLLPDVPTDDYLKQQASIKAGTIESQMVVCRCQTFRLDLHVGSIVSFKEKVGDNFVNNGNLVVVSTEISWNCAGEPVNEITAIGFPVENSRDVLYAPYFDPNAYPQSAPQRAVVIDNIDPDKLGRVQVQYVWQKAPANDDEKGKLPWIRIAQPYGGNQKGCYILPEIGEEVMVGFEHDNMEKPFVIGTFFHNSEQDPKKQIPDEQWVESAGDNKVNEENEVKAFRTKKGHTIEFHDTKEGDGFIRIYGKKGEQASYDIFLSSDPVKEGKGQEAKNYQVTDLTFDNEVKEKADSEVEKLCVLVRSNGGDIMLDAGEGDIIMNAKNIRIHATGNQTTLIDGMDLLKVKGEQHIDVNSKSLLVQKDQSIEVKGKDTEKYDKEVSVDVVEAFNMKAKSLEMKTEQDTVVEATGNVKVTAQQSANLTAKTGLELEGTSEASLKASKTTIQGKATAELSAPQTNVGSDTGMSNVKGATIIIDAKTGSRKGTWTDI